MYCRERDRLLAYSQEVETQLKCIIESLDYWNQRQDLVLGDGDTKDIRELGELMSRLAKVTDLQQSVIQELVMMCDE